MALLDLEPATKDFLEQAIAGLSEHAAHVAEQVFLRRTRLRSFPQICELPEYYVTRTETEILRQYGAEIAESIGENAELVGFGTGAGIKTRMLLEHLRNLIAYVPVDISKQHLTESAEALSREMPSLEILPVCADYLQPIELADAVAETGAHRGLFSWLDDREYETGGREAFSRTRLPTLR